MRKNNGSLTHHEELRLDYLQKNIHYLNAKERRELDYLLTKNDLYQSHKELSKYARNAEPEQFYFADDEQDYDEYDDYDEYEDEEPILPAYPSSRSRRSRKSVAKARPKRPKATPIPKVRAVKPKKKKHWFRRIVMTVLALLLATIVGMAFMFIKGNNSVDDKPVAETFRGQDTKDGTNILILGTDGRAGQTSGEARTDSIMVLNVNNSDHKVKLVSFMRDILIDIEGYGYKLNTAYSLGEQENGEGAEAVRLALKENFDIDIKYYAMVDFSTFATTIDTLFPNGVNMDAQFATVDGETVESVEVPDDLNMVAGVLPYQTIHVGPQKMDGRTLLNYARFRHDDEGDFGRTKRQQQVLSAVISQMKDPTKLFTGSEAAGKVLALTPTTVPQSFLFVNALPLALDGAKGVEKVTVPEFGDWIDDYDIYDGMALRIDFEKYQNKLAEMGLR